MDEVIKKLDDLISNYNPRNTWREIDKIRNEVYQKLYSSLTGEQKKALHTILALYDIRGDALLNDKEEVIRGLSYLIEELKRHEQ